MSKPVWKTGLLLCALAIFLTIFIYQTNKSMSWNLDVAMSPKEVAPVKGDQSADVDADQTRELLSPQKTVNLSVCSHEKLRDFYKQSGYFPGAGHWEATSGGGPNETFVPELCRFRWSTPPRDVIRTALHKASISNIIVIGDSHAKRYFDALSLLIRNAYGNCQKERQERVMKGGLLDAEYFARGDDKLLARLSHLRRPCHTCPGNQVICRETMDKDFDDAKVNASGIPERGNISFSVESIPAFTITGVSGTKTTTSFQKFLWQEYIPSRKPDVILFWPPFTHMKKTGKKVGNVIETVNNILRRNVANTTRIYWMTGYREVNGVPGYHYEKFRYQGRTASAQIDLMNHALWGVMKKHLLNKSSRTYGFFNLHAVSTTRQNWSLDGVHMRPVWFQALANLLLQLMWQPD